MVFKDFRGCFFLVVLFGLSSTNLFGIVLDDFSGSQLDPNIWTFVDPLADSSVSLDGGFLAIEVSAPVSHDVWVSGNRAPRLMQPVEDRDFRIEAKFDSIPSQKYQMQGLLVEQDVGNFI